MNERARLRVPVAYISHRRKGFYETLAVPESRLSRSSAKFVLLARQNSASPSRTCGYRRGVATTASHISRLVARVADSSPTDPDRDRLDDSASVFLHRQPLGALDSALGCVHSAPGCFDSSSAALRV